MKINKLLLIPLISLIIMTACNHSNNSSYTSTVNSSLSSTKSNSTNDIKSPENYSVYEVTDNNDYFSLAISKNDIDEKYQKEYYNQATTTGEMIDVQRKCIEIWKNEMAFSIANLTNDLDKKDKSAFLSAQKQWESSSISNLNFENNILKSDSYNLNIGTSELPLWYSQVREAYK
ncbi:MAG TPA: hypothetical protein VHP31_07075 [Caproicibacter sp.]|nr:hypothetical protein [Caproicibacter sp.]